MFPVVPVVAVMLGLGTLGVTAGTVESHGGSDNARLMNNATSCALPVLTTGGWVCGTSRKSYKGASYASFRGIPYARQPLGELRFVAPQPLQPWSGYFDASVEGPVCPQTNVFYGPMFKPRSMGEDCLRINVHVPATSLPTSGWECLGACRPVVVFVHGGAFQTGSGDSDINAPDYMMDQNIVLITLNYRLGAFGFLSLNTTSVPGNAGLRDIIAALRWVQDNARAFGGDPNRVTLMGQSAGAAAVHILSLSEAAKGLFTKVIVMSGTASAGFFSTLPSYIKYVMNMLLMNLHIHTTNVEEIHRQLNELPYDTILNASAKIVETLGFSGLNPVVEPQIEGVTRVLDENPDLLVARGRGNNYPTLIGFTNVECETLRSNLINLDIISRIKNDTTAVLPVKLYFSAPDEAEVAAERIMKRYFNGTQSLDNYIKSCTDEYIYPAIKLAQLRAATGGAPAFLYQFSYNSDFVPVKQNFDLNYTGAAHLDDLSYVLRVNSILGNTRLNANDNVVKDWMIDIFGNFARCSEPICSGNAREQWPAAEPKLLYQDIQGAKYAVSALTEPQKEMVQLFDSLYRL